MQTALPATSTLPHGGLWGDRSGSSGWRKKQLGKPGSTWLPRARTRESISLFIARSRRVNSHLWDSQVGLQVIQESSRPSKER